MLLISDDIFNVFIAFHLFFLKFLLFIFTAVLKCSFVRWNYINKYTEGFQDDEDI